MRQFLKYLLVIGFFTFFSSCLPQRPISKKAPENNKTYQVEYLFEHNGCKVYRFFDLGHYIYFTNCSGDVTSIENDSIQTGTNVKVKK